MIDHASKLPHLKTNIFTTIGQLAAKHQAVNLSQGFPNFPVDPDLLQLLNQAISDGHHQYAPMKGDFALRERISEKMATLYGRQYDPEQQITVTAGATQALFTAISAFVGPGDEVIVLKPSYDSYGPTIRLHGGKVVPFNLSKDDFGVDWQGFKSKITPSTKMVIINTPHNPSGKVFSKADMLQLQEILAETNIIVLSDEVYEHITFDGLIHESSSKFPDLANRSLVCASFGKTFHVTGWKLGYVAGPKTLLKEFDKVHENAVFCINHPTQRAIAQYLEQPNRYLELAAFYQEKRDYFLEAIRTSRFKMIPTQGTYFQLLDYGQITDEKGNDFAQRLIQEHKIASIPLSAFDLKNQDSSLLRFCFAKTKETLDRAAEILNRI